MVPLALYCLVAHKAVNIKIYANGAELAPTAGAAKQFAVDQLNVNQMKSELHRVSQLEDRLGR